MSSLDVVRHGRERLRAGPWRGDRRTALLAPVTASPPASPEIVRRCLDVLTRDGYTEVITAALAPREQAGFLAAGFRVREELHLLAHDLDDLPPLPATAPRLRRARRRDRPAVLVVDGRAFSTFWRLDDHGLREAVTATPASRFRVATVASSGVIGYAVCGRAGQRGYVQRLAVDPDAQRRGTGRALLLDGLRWMRRRGVQRAVVNTQVGNAPALALYLALGFRLQPGGLAVLTHPLPVAAS